MTDEKIDYKGRGIVIPQKYLALDGDPDIRTLSKDTTQNKIEIFVDGRRLMGGLTAAGKFFLNEYAYDPQESLEDLAKRYVDHLDARAEAKELSRQEESR